jgi:hypothetical protein
MAAALLPVALLLAGCVSVNLGYSLSGNGTASVTWQVEASPSKAGAGDMDTQGMSYARTVFAQMVSSWEGKGMAAQAGGTGDTANVTGSLAFTGAMEESFAKLEGWMKDAQGSPFRSVKSNHAVSMAAEEYMLDAQVDWEDVVDPAMIANAPTGIRNGVDAALKNCKITVTLSLPGTAVEYEGALTEANGIATCTVETSPGKPARIMLHTRVVKAMEAPPARPLLEVWTLPAALALGGLLMLIIAIRIMAKRARMRRY